MSDLKGAQESAYLRSASRIRSARLTNGLSQESLSLESGIDQSTLSKVERLGPYLVSWRKLEALAAALDCVIEIDLVPIGDKNGQVA